MRDAPLPLRLEADSPSYPPRLRTIEAPPACLWARGRVELACARGARVAIVGTRAPTPYGEAQAGEFARALAGAGVVVVSGLARGIDQAAHRGVLEVGGDTIAVLGSGLERPWPAVPLVEEIAERGLLLTEYEPRQSPRPHHFPLRNRIISGLSDAVLVIEAAAASGSLITAQWALDQGREVYALPGRVDQPMSAGCHKLLREGAGLVERPADLLEGLDLAQGVEPRRQRPRSPLEDALQGETLGPDELAERLGRRIEEVLVELIQLELAGRVVRAPGGLYRLG